MEGSGIVHNWKKQVLPVNINGQLNTDVYSTKTSDGKLIQCWDVGGGDSHVLRNQRIEHWVIAVLSKNRMVEPTYDEKLMILREVGVWKNVALEVMPPQYEVVDRENAYHMWEFQYPRSFLFDYTPILQTPETLNQEYEGVRYAVSKVGRVEYLYFKKEDDRELRWKEKQELKNKAIGKYRTAVELILPEMSQKDYSAMICLPECDFLDFGLI